MYYHEPRKNPCIDLRYAVKLMVMEDLKRERNTMRDRRKSSRFRTISAQCDAMRDYLKALRSPKYHHAAYLIKPKWL